MVQLQLNFKNKIKNKTIEKSYTEGFELKRILPVHCRLDIQTTKNVFSLTNKQQSVYQVKNLRHF